MMSAHSIPIDDPRVLSVVRKTVRSKQRAGADRDLEDSSDDDDDDDEDHADDSGNDGHGDRAGKCLRTQKLRLDLHWNS